MPLPFADRRDAGRRLAAALARWRGRRPLVLALPRGGVPVGDEVARALEGELDVLVVRKVGAPGHEELALGALGPDGVVVWNHPELRTLGLVERDIAPTVARERRELERRLAAFRGRRPPPDVAGRVVIVVDDGIATGATARAALRWLRGRGASEVVLAVPVASPDAVATLSREADEVVVAEPADDLGAVGAAYEDFAQVEDAEVVATLRGATPSAAAAPAPSVARAVRVGVRGTVLDGDLTVPSGATAVVVFAHGSGSGRGSPRNRAVARVLEEAGLATLLVDLLDAQEAARDERTACHRFDVALLGARVVGVVDALAGAAATSSLRIGLFGASTGAAAALLAAAERPREVGAVVSRGGRPDLVPSSVLASVQAPTRLVVGGLDAEVLALHHVVLGRLRCPHRLDVVPGASHLFEEPGTLERVAVLARDWFLEHLRPRRG
ncbi:MAG: dienelactone hydrolase family protein [Planctomycetes bacterium]|nr:dienelactone hydrolase family protein [Planctomycetota bacterium]